MLPVLSLSKPAIFRCDECPFVTIEQHSLKGHQCPQQNHEQSAQPQLNLGQHIKSFQTSPASETRSSPSSSSRQAKREQARALIRSMTRDSSSEEEDELHLSKFTSSDSKHESKNTPSATSRIIPDIKQEVDSFSCVLCDQKCGNKNELKKHLETLHVQSSSGKSD